jgi:DNA-binding response OmpR family regulator
MANAQIPTMLSQRTYQERPSVGSTSRCILLAEDDAALRELLAMALEAEGHRVIRADTGNAVIDEVKRVLHYGAEGGVLDLLVSDVRMPKLSGLVALKLLQDAEVRVPVILITAFSDIELRAQAAECGATLIEKPIDLGVFRAAVRRALGLPVVRVVP